MCREQNKRALFALFQAVPALSLLRSALLARNICHASQNTVFHAHAVASKGRSLVPAWSQMRPRTPLVSAAPMRSSEACTDEHDVERALSIRAHVVQLFSRGVSTSTQLNAFESTRCCNTVVLLHCGTQRHRRICSNDLTSVQVGPILFLERSCDSRVTGTQLYASLVHGARRKLTEPVPWNRPVFMSPTVALFQFLFHFCSISCASCPACSLSVLKARRVPAHGTVVWKARLVRSRLVDARSA